MKKVALMVFLVINAWAYAFEIETESFNSPNSSKLEAIQIKIDKYQAIIRNTPEKLQGKIRNFNRLKDVGNKIEDVVNRYLLALKSCEEEVHSIIGEEACNEFDDLDIGTEISKEKKKIINAIKEAERELKEVKKIEQDVPIIKQLVDSLISTKEILMR